MEIADLKQAAQGQWLAILAAHGIPQEALNGKHTQCPGCGGKDRFRFVGGPDGKWFCGQGGEVTGGDGFHLLQHTGMSKADSFKAVAQFLGIDDKPLSPEQRRAIQERKAAEEINRLDRAIQREAHILWQCAGNRVASRKLEQDRAFREARPEWRPYPSQPWAREIQAAQRLRKALGVRYGAA